MKPAISPRGEGPLFQNPVGGEIELKLDAQQTGGALSAFESSAAPGEGPPLHLHEDVEEILYFLSDGFRVQIDERVEDVSAGGFVFIPRLTPHTWQNAGDEEGRLLALFAPGSPGMESFFRAFSRLEAGADLGARFRSLATEAGMQVVGPPIGHAATA